MLTDLLSTPVKHERHVGESLTRWTIRLSLACYAAYLLRAPWRTEATLDRVSRLFWTWACFLLWAHSAAALHFYHHWNHALVVDDTARQTRDLLGWGFGQGIWFSYLLAILWLVDVAWYWFWPLRHATRPRWLSNSIHLYIFFILFNGAIVFESGITRPAGILLCVVLIPLQMVYRRQSKREQIG